MAVLEYNEVVHAYQTIIGAVAGILAFVSFIPYINSIIKGKTKPNRATFTIWSGVNIVTISSYIVSGARTTIFVGLVYTVLQIVVLILSLKRGMGGFNPFDIACLIGATIGITLWIITKNPHTALYLGIFSEVLGLIPTLKKSYLHPDTENTLSWSIAVVGSALNLFALTSWRPEISVYPIYFFIGDLLVALLLWRPAIIRYLGTR